jgi:hypothetical protein
MKIDKILFEFYLKLDFDIDPKIKINLLIQGICILITSFFLKNLIVNVTCEYNLL